MRVAHSRNARNLGRVSIKGGRNDEAVLCTADKTFMLRLAESSNVMLLAPNTGHKRKQRDETTATEEGAAGDEEALEVQASVSAHFEIIRCAPKTGGLLALLSARPHLGASDTEPAEAAPDASTSPSRLTLAELEVAVQASGAELRAALRKARALAVNGRWCVLDGQLEQDIMEALLSLCTEHEWPLNAVPVRNCVELCCEQFAGFDELSVRHCLRAHSAQSLPADGPAAWEAWVNAASLEELALDPSAISCFRVRSLLSMCDVWPKDKFFEAWADALPAGIEPDEALLAGLAVFLPPADAHPSESNPTPMLQALPLSSLSLVPKERFAQLFKVKRNWRLDELAPYVQDLVDPSMAPTKLVLHYSRSVTANDGSVTYVSR